MKRIMRNIFLFFLFASLTGCEGGCEPDRLFVKVVNSSDISIDVGVFWGDGLGWYQIVSPQGAAIYEVGGGGFFTAKAKPIGDWLVFATNRRNEIQKALGVESQNPSIVKDIVDPGRINKLNSELVQINDEIEAYRAQVTSFKTCQGLIPNDNDTAFVYVHNGEATHSITISCRSE
jgi:hypothetical protein